MLPETEHFSEDPPPKQKSPGSLQLKLEEFFTMLIAAVAHGPEEFDLTHVLIQSPKALVLAV
jgi:hypothetical protein